MKRMLPALAATVCFLLFVIPSAFPAGIYEIKHDGQTGTRTVTGVVSAVEGTFRFFIADASAPYHGIYIDQTSYGPDIGDEVTVTGNVNSVAGRIQLQNISSYTVNSINNPVYAPIELTIGQLRSNLDAHEGSLVKLTGPLTVTNQRASDNTWVVSDGSNSVTIYGYHNPTGLDYNYFPHNGDVLDAIGGIVKKTGATSFYIMPRFTNDLWAANDLIPNYALKGTVVTMDDARSVLDDHYIWIRGDNIESVTAEAPAGAEKIIEVNGLIFPGLISTHDHPTWNIFDFIPFGRFFRERNDWAGDVFGGSMYHDFKYQSRGHDPVGLEITRLTEVRLASSGATVLQGAGSDATGHYGKLGHGIILGERFPGRVQTRVAGATSNPSQWAGFHIDGERGKLHRYMPHLGETTDAGPTMANQWTLWKGFDSFDGRDTLIHGMNIPAGDFALFDHGTDAFGRPLRTVLSWAAKSNMLLYDATADIPGALAHNAIVALAPDWTPSGMPNMLAELNFARSVALDKNWNIQTQVFIDMVTRNAAIGFGQLWRMGTLEAGKMANLMVIEYGDGDPYDDLMMVAGGGEDPDYRCGPKDVRLTVVAGRPIYGDDDLLNTANFPFLWEDNIEDLTICGVVKKLKIARRNPGFLTDLAGQPFGPMYGDLWSRYLRSPSYPADFLSVNPDNSLPPTPAPSPSPPPGTYVITSWTDDACQHSTFYTDVDEFIWVSRASTAAGYNSGFRFNDIQVDPGRQITEAYLVFTQYFRDNSDTVNLQITAHSSDNSPAFTSGNGPLNRPLTSTRMNWTMPPAAVNAEIVSPDISSVIQEIVDRPGWNPGNSISIVMVPTDTAQNRRRVWGYVGPPERAARLVIVDDPTPVPVPTPVICTRIDEGFDGFVGPDWEVPAGWSFSGIGAGDVYTDEGDYGHASPSLRFDTDGNRITTPVFAPGEWLQFWAKGQGVDSSSSLLIEEEYYSSWVPLASIQPLPVAGRRYTGVTLHPQTSQVRFTFQKSAGELALDDILIKCRMTPSPTPVGFKTPVLTPTATPPPPTETLVLYTFGEPDNRTLAPEEVSPAVTASNFNVSAGSILYGTWDSEDWAALGSGIPYVRSSDGWDAGDMEEGKYFYCTVTPQTPGGVTVNRVSFLYRVPADDDGPRNIAVVAGDTLVATIDPVVFGATTAVVLEGLSIDLTEETTFKIVGWDSLFDSGEFRVDDIKLSTTSELPPTPTPTPFVPLPPTPTPEPTPEPTATPEPTPTPAENTLVYYPFTEESLSPAFVAADVNAGEFSVSEGSISFGDEFPGDWTGSGVPYAYSTEYWDAESWDEGKAYYFVVSPVPTNRIRVDEIDFLYRIPAGWNSSPTRITVAAGDEELDTVIDPVGNQVNAYSIDSLGLILAGETTFKVVGWGAQSTLGGAELRIDDVRVGGEVIPAATPALTPEPTPETTPEPTPQPTPEPTPQPTPEPPSAAPWITDYDGDGTSDVAIYRSSSGLWAVRGVTRVYFGGGDDIPVPGDYTGDGTTDIAIFRESTGLWAVREGARSYFGTAGDLPIPGDYSGDGTADIGIYREASGLWAVRGVTRVYFGSGQDDPVPGYYSEDGKKSIAIFRPTSGLWAIRGVTRVYFGGVQDSPVPGDYEGDGFWTPAIYRPASGLWATRSGYRVYFGQSTDEPIPGGYRGDGQDYPGIFRPASGLWAIRGVTRVYFGSGTDIPMTR